LVGAPLSGDKVIMLLAYEYERWPMEPAIRAFEVLAADLIDLCERHETAFDELVQPVHTRGAVVAWQVADHD
jgi:hypothetical protein